MARRDSASATLASSRGWALFMRFRYAIAVAVANCNYLLLRFTSRFTALCIPSIDIQLYNLFWTSFRRRFRSHCLAVKSTLYYSLYLWQQELSFLMIDWVVIAWKREKQTHHRIYNNYEKNLQPMKKIYLKSFLVDCSRKRDQILYCKGVYEYTTNGCN